MLEKLNIKNIGGIREVELEFSSGLNVITGESGAGKSSIIRSLELLSGSRGGVKFIRAGENKGEVEAFFSDGKIISREILSTGRSKAKIQGINTGLSECAEIVNNIIKIQSQFAQIELLESERQLAMLDSCLNENIKIKVIQELARVFELAKNSGRELREMKKRRNEIEKQYENSKDIFELVKISKPEPGLENILENSLLDLTHKITRFEKAKISLDILSGGLSERGLIESINNNFENLYEFLSEDDKNAIKTSIYNLESEIKSLSEKISDNEEILNLRDEVENRLGALRKLKRISGISDEKELLKFCDEIRENIEWLEKSYKDYKFLSEKTLDLKRQANFLAMELRKARHETAEILCERVNKVLNKLGMPEIKFEIDFSSLQKLRKNGADEINFILNDGTRSGKVNKIASGGELSRILLALQLSLPDEWLPPTIIFDEVEAGLGGRAAVLSGLQLKDLSKRCQVILVTHEASIAALGDSHILIQRIKNDTIVKKIHDEERVKEIARMLSGYPDMTEAQEHAKILLK